MSMCHLLVVTPGVCAVLGFGLQLQHLELQIVDGGLWALVCDPNVLGCVPSKGYG